MKANCTIHIVVDDRNVESEVIVNGIPIASMCSFYPKSVFAEDINKVLGMMSERLFHHLDKADLEGGEEEGGEDAN